MPTPTRAELPIIQATIVLIRSYVPLINGLPRAHKFGLGDRITANLHNFQQEFQLIVLRRPRAATQHPIRAGRDAPLSRAPGGNRGCCGWPG
jgi:hypothetical protein